MVKARKPHFLEVFLPALCTDRLKVPTRFTKHLVDTSGSIILKGPSDNSWHVDLIEHNGHLFFDDGWHAFVKDHSIECGDSLVFGYDGNSHFTVQIFDQSSCEKEEAFQAKCSGKSSYLNGSTGREKKRREASISNLPVDKSFTGGLVPIHLDFPGGDRDQKLEECCSEEKKINEVVMNEYDNRTHASIEGSERPIVIGLPCFPNSQEMLAIIQSQRKKFVSKFKKGCSASKAKIGCSASKVKKSCSKKKKTETQKKSSLSEFVEEKAAHYFSSSFPYFVRVMKHSNIMKGTLKIPVKFSKEHLPNHRVKVVVRNLDGDPWMLNFIPTAKLNSTSYSFCGGWSAFVRCNGIKMEDVCIFELVDKIEMRVHILRLGLEGLESRSQKGGNDAYGVTGVGPLLKIVENVPENNEVHPFNIIEQTDDVYINGDEEHQRDADMTPGIEEAEYSINTSDFDSALVTSVHYDPFPLSILPNQSTEHFLTSNDDGTISYQTDIKSGAELYASPSMNTQPIAGDERADHLFTSPFPTFSKVMMSSNVSGSITLAIPRKFSGKHLQTPKNEIVLRNMRGECWNVVSNRYGLQTMFGRGWSSFVHQNGVKLGDVCIFELIEDKVFQVHINNEASHEGQKCLLGSDYDYDDSITTIQTTQCSHSSEI